MIDINKKTANFKNLYHNLNRENIDMNAIKLVYSDHIYFEDCFHSIEGVHKLFEYFKNLYSNVTFIEFQFINEWEDDSSAVLTWNMSYQHPKLNQGRKILVNGASELTFEAGKIIKHKDYFDAGALLYEHIPLLKRIILFLKHRMA